MQNLLYKKAKEIIRMAMNSKQITQKALANRLNKNQQNINYLLNNKKDMSLSEFEEVMEALDFDISKLAPMNIIQNNRDEAKDNVNVLINEMSNTEIIDDLVKKIDSIYEELNILKQRQDASEKRSEN